MRFCVRSVRCTKSKPAKAPPKFPELALHVRRGVSFGILFSTSAIPSWTVLYQRHESRPARTLRWQMSLQSQHCFEETYTLLYFLLGSLSKNHKKPRNQSCTDASRSSPFLKGWPPFLSNSLIVIPRYYAGHPQK